jgi:hypothetical protein
VLVKPTYETQLRAFDEELIRLFKTNAVKEMKVSIYLIPFHINAYVWSGKNFLTKSATNFKLGTSKLSDNYRESNSGLQPYNQSLY